ncbi:MAG: hypothetical protein IJ449_09000 [Clostridia bacterium]|nr:hypothetical protein [Clostridia bacterium]
MKNFLLRATFETYLGQNNIPVVSVVESNKGKVMNDADEFLQSILEYEE